MEYRIYPPLGIARIGNHKTEFYIGPETPGSNGTEIVGGIEQPISEHKSGDTGDPNTRFRMKRQAARFRLYEVDAATGESRPATLPPEARVDWTVHLVNKKGAVKRPAGPPASPMAVESDPLRQDRHIDGGQNTITSGQSATFIGFYLGNEVSLGEIRTDDEGNLLVLGGDGTSRTFEGAPLGPDFYNNLEWHDDVADGPVTARILLPDGTEHLAVPAWVVVAPPDFAPSVRGIVTLHDRILDAAEIAQVSTPIEKPSFTHHVKPMLDRARGLRWVHDNAAWRAPMDYVALSDTGPAAAMKRKQATIVVKTVETAFTHADYTFHLCKWQHKVLKQFEDGDFVADFGTATPIDSKSAPALTRSVLDGTVGEGFYPGIEAGIILTDISLYSQPFEFRLDHQKVSAGDLTALMALPWQADFKKCSTGWWPTQRPNVVPPTLPPRKRWDRGLAESHTDWVDRGMMLGVVTPRADTPVGAEVQEESRRDPDLGP